MPTALITGASRGLGHAAARALAERGWDLIVDARDGDRLRAAVAGLGGPGNRVLTVPGDVASPGHRSELAAAVAHLGRLDLLLNNASSLGPSPLPPLVELPPAALTALLSVNTVAPLALIQLVLPQLRAGRGVIVNVSSDAAVEPYPGWGGYGASKAALDHLSTVLAVELPELTVYAFDPGDMRTDMHQAAYPGQDISDRPSPDTVVPALLRLIDHRPPDARHRATDLRRARELPA